MTARLSLCAGGAGWGLVKACVTARFMIDGNAGNAVAASIRAGTVVRPG